MKVLLINPSISLRYGLGYRLFNSFSIPLSLAYIAAVLEQEGITVIIKDQYASRRANQDIVRDVLMEKPDIVGFSCLANTLDIVRQISNGIKNVYQPTIVAGNINATVFAEELLRDRIVDIVVRGEGEYTMRELSSAIRDNKNLSNVRGISYLQNGKVVHNADRPPIENIDKLPYPAHHLFDLDEYKDQLFFLRRGRILPVSVSRGCNYQCLFCSNRIIHKKFSLRMPERIAEEIAFLYDTYGVRTFGMVGSYFPVEREHTERLCQILTEKGLHKKVSWFIESRVDKVNPTLLKRMKEAGLYFVMYGCDFGTQKMLDRMHKDTTCQQVKEAVGAARTLGIVTACYFLLGGPGETKQDREETIRFAMELDCDIAKFNITVPYPGSKLLEIYRRQHPIGWEELDRIGSWMDWSFEQEGLYADTTFSSKELIQLQRKAMFKFYFRPAILKRLKVFIHQDLFIKYVISAGYVMFQILLKMLKSVCHNMVTRISGGRRQQRKRAIS